MIDLLISLAIVAFPFLVIGAFVHAHDSIYRTSCKEPGGRMHQWSMPVFRVRVCDHCGRRECFMRAWEFDGYERKEQ